jgi:hypothetical protein
MPSLMPDVDLVVRERRLDVRIIASLPGRYWLVPRGGARGEVRQFACRAINISPHALALAAPVQGTVGRNVLVEIEHFGKLDGSITRLLTDRGFVMTIAASDEERGRLADKILWLEKHKNLEVSDRRTQTRFAPKSPYSTLMLADGSMRTCFVIDLSVTGAAVSADIVPELGTVVAVGKVVGRVIRHVDGGFAVKFHAVQDRRAIERLVTRR